MNIYLLLVIIVLNALVILCQIELDQHYKVTIPRMVTTILIISSLIYRLYFLYGINHFFLMTLLCITFLLIVSIKDIKNKEVPMNYLLLTIIMGFVLVWINPNVTLIESLVGGGIGVSLMILGVITRNAIGQGDGLVVMAIGILVGWQMTLAILSYGLIISACYSGYLLIIKRKSRKTKIPFVPFLFIASMIMYLL
ncbi:prepilin peptidase [Natranaerovirga pectinivora]|uniref:prepilin peptidase n=1 Tax=Natranaerovirga pectinivora TaxID=682400 RepID=UPI001404285F|nr:A24 family peptidase [Natranaerovirga pectinivora]